MRENLIQISPFQLLNITSMEGVQQINEHGYLSFSGHIRQDAEEACLAVASQENPIVQIYVRDEAEKRVLFFAGILTELEIKIENQLKLLTATVMTGNYLMDLNPHVRSFQSSDISYRSILSTLSSGYQNAVVTVNTGGEDAIGGLVLQYRETDWAFAKRLASRFHTVLIPNSQSGYPSYDFGLCKNGASREIESNTYSITKDLADFLYSRENGVKQRSEMGAICYVFRSREIYMLGEHVLFNHQPTYIRAIKTELEGAELYHTYFLALEDGLQIPQMYNDDVIGASLSGRVVAVQKASVQIRINQDENAGQAGTRWFPYSTVYSTPDGTGWYCMPEVGDAVRLYIPGEREEQAYVASSAHQAVASGAARSNPNNKSIMNKQGKEILFTPSSLMMTNNAGMSIELSDQDGIKIISDKAIQIKSDAAVDITSATSTLQVVAPKELIFNQGGTAMRLKDRLSFKGAQIRLD